MQKIWWLLKKLFLHIIKLIVIILFNIVEPIGIKILYVLTKERNEKDGILSKKKYIRIKKSIRYKLWLWNNMRWLCNLCNLNFTPYNKFYKNKRILKY